MFGDTAEVITQKSHTTFQEKILILKYQSVRTVFVAPYQVFTVRMCIGFVIFIIKISPSFSLPLLSLVSIHSEII